MTSKVSPGLMVAGTEMPLMCAWAVPRRAAAMAATEKRMFVDDMVCVGVGRMSVDAVV